MMMFIMYIVKHFMMVNINNFQCPLPVHKNKNSGGEST
jgi:hypothetical protein